MALALDEAGWLGAYYAGGVDHYSTKWGRMAREAVGKAWPKLDRLLARRRIGTIPEARIKTDWRWEAPRTLSRVLGLGEIVEDYFWERSEWRLDARSARALARGEFDAFIGVEHGCLRSLQAARQAGKKSVVSFESPHHLFRARWVDSEYEQYPELFTPAKRKLQQLGQLRDARRDREAELADVIQCASQVTATSLVEAGFDSDKIVTLPYGCPEPIPETALPQAAPRPARIVYVGRLDVRKGIPYLLDAWRSLRPGKLAELHLYGLMLLPKRLLDQTGESVVLHGSVDRATLFEAYREASVMVLPTLCDGLGIVALHALAHGLPVITTPNAGAAMHIEPGKNGFLVPPRNSQALAEALEWCLQHPDELLAMRRYALATARRHSWEQYRAEVRRNLAERLAPCGALATA
jgi:glycosyltransferase involved in cell wall biosynthesis